MARKKRSAKKRSAEKKSLGRPRKDVDDQVIVDLAAALAEILPLQGYQLGPQRLRDLALALKEGPERELTPQERAKLPRRFQRPGVPLTHELPMVSYKGREGAIAQKLHDGTIKPRPDVVARLVDDFTRSIHIARAFQILQHLLAPQKPK